MSLTVSISTTTVRTLSDAPHRLVGLVVKASASRAADPGGRFPISPWGLIIIIIIIAFKDPDRVIPLT